MVMFDTTAADVVSINLRLCDSDAAPSCLYDSGFLYGYGLFESVRVFKQKTPLLPYHLMRFFNSAAALGIAIEWSKDAISEAVYDLLQSTPEPHGLLHIYLTAGDRDFSKPGFSFGPATLIMTTRPLSISNPPTPMPAHCQLIDHPRGPLDCHKTLSYLSNVLLSTQSPNSCPILQEPDGTLLETPTSAIGFQRGNTLFFSDHPFILPSVSVQHIESLAPTYGFTTTRTRLSVDLLDTVDGIFACNAVQGIVPLSGLGCDDEGVLDLHLFD